MLRGFAATHLLNSRWATARWNAARSTSLGALRHEASGLASASAAMSPAIAAGCAPSDRVSNGTMVAKTLQLDEVDARMLELAARGHTNLEIARRLRYSRQAVEWHLGRLMRHWRVRNRASLVAEGFARGALSAR